MTINIVNLYSLSDIGIDNGESFLTDTIDITNNYGLSLVVSRTVNNLNIDDITIQVSNNGDDWVDYDDSIGIGNTEFHITYDGDTSINFPYIKIKLDNTSTSVSNTYVISLNKSVQKAGY